MDDKKQFRPITSLHNWEHNPRSVTKDGIERLIKQIKKLGVYKPLLITEDGTVLGGNMRLQALQQMGEKEVWVSVVDAPTEEKKIEYALSDNDRVGKYEADDLANLIGNFPEVEWGDYSVDIKEPELVSDLMDKFRETEEDEAPAVEEGEAESKLGEVYQLGRHTLMCGDSTDAGSVALLMNGQKADMVFTDPPYGVSYENNKRVDGHEYKRKSTYKKIENDDLTPDKFVEFMNVAINNMNMSLKEEAVLYLCTSDKPDFRQSYENACKHNNLKYSAYLIWDKGNFGFGFQNYRASHEGILYYKKGSVEDMWIGGQDKGTIINIKKDANKEYNHPTQKPVALPLYCINNHKGDIILDLFGGSGSTLIACEQTNRTCYMMELDPHYCDVIRKRYDNFVQKTGQEQENNGK